MANVFYRDIALVDASAAVALHDPSDSWHELATEFFSDTGTLRLAALDLTSYETYTRTRYRRDASLALEAFDFLRGPDIWQLSPLVEDVARARARLSSLPEHRISFHDALCAMVMQRKGIFKIVTFDRDFWVLGCEVLPGATS